MAKKKKKTLADLPYDLLEALLAREPEFSWEYAESAPLPQEGKPRSFYVKERAAEAAIAAAAQYGGSSTRGTSILQQPSRRSARPIARVNPDHETAGNWTAETFPFNYRLPREPSKLTPLLLNNNGGFPTASVIVSPYLRIPTYTFCARTSANWRLAEGRSLRSRCHMDYLPFFGENEYEDNNEFRSRITEVGTKIAFHIPDEYEKDQPEEPPSNTMCALCLTVGCIMHHTANAVAQPTAGADDEPGPSKALLLPSQAVSATMLGHVQGPRMIRRKSRTSQNCGPDCFHTGKPGSEEAEHVPIAQWTEQERKRFTEVCGVLESVVSSDARDKAVTSCIVSQYMMTRSCADVEFALRERRDRPPSADIEFIGIVKGKKILESENAAAKKRKIEQLQSQHEKQRQRDVGAKSTKKRAEDNESFSEMEIRLKMPRTAMPWSPCHHPGRSCDSFSGNESARDVYCACKRNGTFCDVGCGCPVDCPDRFPGCRCAEPKNGSSGTCKAAYEDARGKVIPGCPCAASYRECHPELCAGHEETSGKCKFMMMQDDRQIRTFIANSELEGYGLFIGEDTGAQTRLFIGEYRGELINENEAQMRSLLYQTRQRSFLFDLNKLSVVDGMRLGNKTRYINTARNRGKNNCRGDSTQINGETRLLIHTSKEGKQKLQKGDELLLDYGENYELFGNDD